MENIPVKPYSLKHATVEHIFSYRTFISIERVMIQVYFLNFNVDFYHILIFLPIL